MAEKVTSSGVSIGGSSKPRPQPTPSGAPAPTPTPLAQKYGLSPAAPTTTDRMVWLGEKAGYKPESEVKSLYAFMSPEMSKAFYSRLDKLFPYGWQPGWVESQWEKATSLAAQSLMMGDEKKVTPLQAFDNLLANSVDASIASGGGGGGGGGGAAGPTKSINLTDPGTAETLVDQALQGYLGRKASDKEITQFRKALTRAEMAAPSETEVVGDTAIRSGGFNPATFAQQYAEGMEGAAEYQTATTFLDSFIEAIGPRVDV